MTRFLWIILGLNSVLGVIAVLVAPWLDGPAQIIALSHLSVVTLLLPPLAFKRSVPALDPLLLVVVYVIVGAIIPSYLLAFYQSDRLRFILNGLSNSVIMEGSFWYLFGTFLIGCGYASCRRRIPIEHFLPTDAGISARGIQIASFIGILLTALATILFVGVTGGLEALSAKRSVQITTASGTVHGSGAYYRMMGDLSLFLLLIGCSFWLRNGKPLPWFSTLALTLAASMIPFLASSRESVLYIFLGLLVVIRSFREISPQRLAVVLTIASLSFITMTALRSQTQGHSEAFHMPNALIALGESGNGLSLIGTTHILQGVPENLPYQFGATYFSWLTAPIPRQLWPEKPDVSLGKRVRAEILGQPVIRSGRPPSVLSEGWMNFGPVGFMLGAFWFGFSLRFVSTSFLPVLKKNVLLPPVYVAVALALTGMVNAAFSQAAVRILTDLTLIASAFGLILLASRKRYSVAKTGRPARGVFMHSVNCRITSKLIETRLAHAAPTAPWRGMRIKLPMTFTESAPKVSTPKRFWRPATIRNAESGTLSAPQTWASASTLSTSFPWAKSGVNT